MGLGVTVIEQTVSAKDLLNDFAVIAGPSQGTATSFGTVLSVRVHAAIFHLAD